MLYCRYIIHLPIVIINEKPNNKNSDIIFMKQLNVFIQNFFFFKIKKLIDTYQIKPISYNH